MSNVPSERPANQPRTLTMRADCFLLCDAAEAKENMLYILKGGWDHLTFPSLPASHPSLTFAIRILVGWSESSEDVYVEINLEREGGERVGTGPIASGNLNVARPVNRPRGEVQPVCMTVPVGPLYFTSPGIYAFVLLADGQELARTEFHVAIRQ